jgi:hypothetical protein
VKRLNTKKIEMFAGDPFTPYLAAFPAPAKKFVPKWFREFPLFFSNKGKYAWLGPKGNNSTFKACMPLFDTMTSGYMIPVPMDIYVLRDEAGIARFQWRDGGETPMVGEHDLDQIPDQMVPDEYERIPYKFASHYHITTPPGYSLLFVHPLNRMDLPFHSISGFVDTDKYNAVINFPFFLKKGFEGLIEAGTPMLQAIPVKREPWEMGLDKVYDEEKAMKTNGPLFSKMFRGYRDHFWSKKDYS